MGKTNTIGKITVRHYLNTNLKPYKVDGDKLYKLYFLVRYQNKNTKIKSLIDVELTEKEYSQKIKSKDDILTLRIKNEKQLVEKAIKISAKMGLPFEIKLFRSVWDVAVYPIIETFEKNIEHYKNLISLEPWNSPLYDNIETFESVLNTFKLFVLNSKHSITDELFLIQFLDEEIINDYKAGLSKDEQTQIIYVPEKSKDGNIIKTEYRDKETDNVEIIKTFVLDNTYYLFAFPYSSEREEIKNLKLDESNFERVIRLITET